MHKILFIIKAKYVHIYKQENHWNHTAVCYWCVAVLFTVCLFFFSQGIGNTGVQIFLSAQTIDDKVIHDYYNV